MVLTNSGGDFRVERIDPTKEELLGDAKFFRKNIIEGAFSNVEHYLDVQYRLLREDFVSNVREALETRKKLDIYYNVTIFRARNRKDEECVKVRVSCKIDKSFMNGSLLIFTQNNFKDFFMGVVVQKLKEQDEVIIELKNCNDPFNLGGSYTMAECSQYYDPYFQVLTALQNISTKNFPMEKYIVYVDTSSVYVPRYLLKANLKYKIDKYIVDPLMIPHINQNLLNLNEPQLVAFKAALTQEFVVIQGPPGTGKTHLGVKIAQTLIKNSHFWYQRTPLLVVSHKNEALDQFLEGLLPITSQLVRVGGQSKSAKLRPFNLANQRAPRVSNLSIMQKALVVGMTTSIAARWREDLENLKAPIVIVEEAAEVLESHVIAALTNHCQHLILLGDHQQLQPIAADYSIGKNFHLEVSLFERMVRNRVQHYQLSVQHRMKPDISDLLKVKIYPFLEDHESTRARPDIQGVEKSVFFFDHGNPEENCNSTSKINMFEARFCANLAKYLVLNGYTPDEIVILATYSAQYQEIEKLVKKDSHTVDVKVSTLDGFQGQEAEIVLLSLVRSAEPGFLGKPNRVCVALSRARNGLYIIGNMTMLARTSKLWASIKSCLAKKNSIGKSMVIKCQRHGNLMKIETLNDFWRVQNGGCDKMCNLLLICGHNCCLMCHNDCVIHKCSSGCVRSRVKSEVRTAYQPDLWRPPTTYEPVAAKRTPTFIDYIIDGVAAVASTIWNGIVKLFT